MNCLLDRIYITIYTLVKGSMMQKAKLFQNGRSQAVRLPKNFQFSGDEVFIQKHGEAVLLVPHHKAWEVFMDGLSSFSDDFMNNGRDQEVDQDRENL